MHRPVSRPNNPYLPAPHLEISNATYELEKQARAFEAGVDAGRKWGNEEWRERLKRVMVLAYSMRLNPSTPLGKWVPLDKLEALL